MALVGEPPMIVIDIVGNKHYFTDLLLGFKAFIAFHFAFNIEYMKEARDVWYFTQFYVFGIKPISEQKKKPVKSSLAKDLGWI